MLGENRVTVTVFGSLGGPVDVGIDVKVYQVLDSTDAAEYPAYPDHRTPHGNDQCSHYSIHSSQPQSQRCSRNRYV